MQREQGVVSFSGSDLLGIESAQRGNVHDRAVENLARGERNSLLQDFHRTRGIHAFDARLGGGAYGDRLLAAKEVVAAHMGDTRDRAGAPRTRLRPGLHHLMWMLPRER